MHQLQRFPNFIVYRCEQIRSELIEQARQQYEQPVVQVHRMRQYQLVDGVQKQRIHLRVRVDKHLAEQIQNADQVMVGQLVAVGQIVRQAGEALLALRPMRRRAVQNDGGDVFDRRPVAVELAARTVPRAGLSREYATV